MVSKDVDMSSWPTMPVNGPKMLKTFLEDIVFTKFTLFGSSVLP